MYKAVFESQNGDKYVFGVDGDTVFDIDIGNGVSVDIGTSQGFLQIGETVESQSVTGRPINVKGVIYSAVDATKQRMRKVFAPFVRGRLVFEGKYYTNVYVKSTPTFSPKKGDGRFSMQLFAPYPFFYSVEEKSSEIGKIEPLFRFPINYATPHAFGMKSDEKYNNIINSGDVKVSFKVVMVATGESNNPVVTNLETLEFLKLNGSLSMGDTVTIYRDSQGILRAELKRSDELIDIISWIDEESTLFELNVGDNLIAASDDGGGTNLTTRFSYNPAVVAVYES